MTAERPHITLSDLVKIQGFATTGGQAKQRVRDGGIQVDGVEEVRPGRKLFGGETVTIEGEKFGVSLGEGDLHSDDKNSDDKNSDGKKSKS